MTFTDFKTKAEEYPNTSVGIVGHSVRLSSGGNIWAMFPVSRIDKMEDILNTLKFYYRPEVIMNEPSKKQLRLF